MPDNINSPLINDKNETLVHGGQLNKMAKQYHIPLNQWLDLSTGIAPNSYPVPAIPQRVWQQLPQTSEALLQSAYNYYQTKSLLPIAGSQSVIQILPLAATQQGYGKANVWLPKIGYQEHYKAWKAQGFTVKHYQAVNDIILKIKDIVVLINPNNPNGAHFSYKQVAQLFNHVKQQNGLMIIDEAFMDCTPKQSFIKHSDNQQLIVLRSVGKFFGLAGLRLGFVAASANWLRLFENMLGPWSINGPAQYIGQIALADKPWQIKQRAYLKAQSQKLAVLLQETFNETSTGTYLFQTIRCRPAPLIFEKLCQQGVYVRLCDEKNALRFGLTSNTEIIRLKASLKKIMR